MVSGGSSKLVSVELLHINGSNICSLPDLPAARSEHTQNGPLLCGGRAGSGNVMGTCVNFCEGSWDQSHSLEHHAGRTSHVSWASPGGLMLIGGYLCEAGQRAAVRGWNINKALGRQYWSASNGCCHAVSVRSRSCRDKKVLLSEEVVL